MPSATLSVAKKREFENDGFILFEEFKPDAALHELRERACALVEAFDPAEAMSIFSARDARPVSDDYFLSSGDKIRCFFEEDAIDARGAMRVPKALAINKIGHAMHDLDPVFQRFSHDDRLESIARDLGQSRPLAYQSMYIFKQPRIGGEVRWHQDATYLYSDPPSVLTFWFAIEDATRENGCLWVQPGGHRSPLRERFIVDAQGARMLRLDDTPWPLASQAEALEVRAGTLAVFSGLLPHYSGPNRSAASRHAYTLHAVDAAANYAKDNWLQRDDALTFRGFS